MKPSFLHLVRCSVVLTIVVGLPACQPPSSTLLPTPPPELPVVNRPSPASTSQSSTAKSPTTKSPTQSPTTKSPTTQSPTVVGDPFQKGVDKAASATNLAESAQTPEDWSLVLNQWQGAIALMKAVPASSSNRAAAQKLIGEYQQSLARARQQSKQGPAPQVAGKTVEDGEILIAGGIQPSPNADSANAKEAASNINALIQQQTQFFQQKKRFAANLAELGSTVPPDTPNYTYSTAVVQPGQVTVTAIAKQDGRLSYTGAVFVVKDANNETTAAGICSTQQPSKTPPAPPQIAGKQVKCALGSTAL